MISYINNKGLIVFLTMILAFVYLVILSLQGLDLCDEGWCLSFYQQFFNNPISVQYQFMYYLTGVFGGIWNTIFGWGGIFSFRLLNIIVILSTAYITFKTTENYINSVIFAISTVCLILLANYGNIVFHHNSFTSLLIAISVFFLFNGICKNKKWIVFLGGALLGISFFARIANVSMLTLSIIFIINLLYTKDWRRFWESIIFFICGCFIGILVIIGTMYFMGHYNIFVDSLKENLFSAGTDQESNHNLITMMITYLNQYKAVIKFLILYVFLFMTFVISFRFFKKKIIRMILTLLLLIFSFLPPFRFGISQYYAFVLLPILLSFFFDYRNKSIILLNAAGLIIMFFLPLGSDSGISNMGLASLWLGTFMAFGHYYRFSKIRKQLNDYSIVMFFGVSILALFSLNLFTVSKTAYFDKGDRFEKRFKLENKLANVYTTEKKSEILNELLNELDKYVRAGDTMLCFESLPMIQYLTKTVPFIGTSWVWVYDPNNFKRNLSRAENSTYKKPVILRQKTQPISGEWTHFDIRYNDILSEDTYLYKKQRIIYFNQFLSRNNYHIVWENELFQILLVDSS